MLAEGREPFTSSGSEKRLIVDVKSSINWRLSLSTRGTGASGFPTTRFCRAGILYTPHRDVQLDVIKACFGLNKTFAQDPPSVADGLK